MGFKDDKNEEFGGGARQRKAEERRVRSILDAVSDAVLPKTVGGYAGKEGKVTRTSDLPPNVRDQVEVLGARRNLTREASQVSYDPRYKRELDSTQAEINALYKSSAAKKPKK
jgi:hypothetical protein